MSEEVLQDLRALRQANAAMRSRSLDAMNVSTHLANCGAMRRRLVGAEQAWLAAVRQAVRAAAGADCAGAEELFGTEGLLAWAIEEVMAPPEEPDGWVEASAPRDRADSDTACAILEAGRAALSLIALTDGGAGATAQRLAAAAALARTARLWAADSRWPASAARTPRDLGARDADDHRFAAECAAAAEAMAAVTERTPRALLAAGLGALAAGGRGHHAGAVRDLVLHLAGSQNRAVHRVSLNVLLVFRADYRIGGPSEQGLAAPLVLEALSDGTGELYASPLRMAFHVWDEAWQGALDAAWRHTRSAACGDAADWPSLDVRWWLELPAARAAKRSLAGDSAGGAFALGLSSLLAAM